MTNIGNKYRIAQRTNTSTYSSKTSTKDVSRDPKVVPNTSQKHPQRPPQSKKTPGLCPGHKKTNFERPAPPSCTPKRPRIRPPNGTKTTQNQEFILYAKKHRFSLLFRDHKITFWEPKCSSLGYTSDDLHHREITFDFSRMYCTDCMFLQSKPFELRYERQSERALFHVLHKPSIQNSKKHPKECSKSTPKPSSGALGSIQKRRLKLATTKSHFLRWSPPGGFAVPLAWDLEMGPRLYI